jgi:hypothetical protein
MLLGAVEPPGAIVPPGAPIPPLVVPGVLEPSLVPAWATSRQPEIGALVTAAEARACTSICAA